MIDYYGELGVPVDATWSELRRAYRARARVLHPDVNPDGDGDDAMRRLNEAWRVLRDPRARRDYDLARAGGPAAAEHWAPPAPSMHRMRPAAWMVVVAILAAIFVITAYAAGPAPVAPVPRPQADRCLAHFPGYDAFVSCSQPNVGRVVADLPSSASGTCPAGSTPHAVLGRADTACLAGAP